MIIKLERKQYPVVKCIRFEGRNLAGLLEVAGANWAVRLYDNNAILSISEIGVNRVIEIRKGEYLINDNGILQICDPNYILSKYKYLDFDKGQQLEYDLESSVEARAAFFNNVKNFFKD